MSDRTSEGGHKSRSRNRDQRMPTFHMLLDHDQHHHEYHFHHHGKPEIHKNHQSQTSGRKSKSPRPTELAANFKLNKNENSIKGKKSSPVPRSHSLNPDKLTLPGIHKSGPSNESVSSVGSSRGPACNFSQFYVNESETNEEGKAVRGGRQEVLDKDDKRKDPYRPQKHKPRQHKLSSPPLVVDDFGEEEEEIIDEPADKVVWNASKETSKSNIVCPLSESEQWRIAMKKTDRNSIYVKRVAEKERKARSSSVPHSRPFKQMQPNYPVGITSSILFNPEDMGHGELLDDCLPPPVREISSSVSISPTHSLHIFLVTQQLEKIEQAQNDILKQLGDDIAEVSLENDKLKKEIEHVRAQNEGLLKVVKESSEELERLKQIIRIRNMSHLSSDQRDEPEPQSLIKDRDNDRDRVRERPRGTSLPSEPQAHGNRLERRRSRHRSRSRSKDSSRGNEEVLLSSCPRPNSPRHSQIKNKNNRHDHNHNYGSGENPIDLPITVGQVETQPRPRNKLRDDDSDEAEKLKNGCYMGLNIMVNRDYDDETSYRSVDSYDADANRKRRTRSRSRERRNDSNVSNISQENISRRNKLHDNKRPSPLRENKRPEIMSSTKRNHSNSIPPKSGGNERGCFGRMFSCCLPKPAYEKDCEDDIGILHNCPE